MDFINTFIERKLNKKTTHNSKGFVACAARTMKPVLNGTVEIPQLWVFR